MAKKVIQPATLEDQKELNSVTENKADVVELRGKKIQIKWMHPETLSKVSDLMLQKGNDNTIIHRSAALIVLNDFWKCHLFYWFVWRWFYYVKQYTFEELFPIIDLAQKKTASEVKVAYLNATILLTVLQVAKKQMTKAEADLILQEQYTDKGGK